MKPLMFGRSFKYVQTQQKPILQLEIRFLHAVLVEIRKKDNLGLGF